MTPEAAQRFPDDILGKEIPDVLLTYQQKLLATTSLNRVTVVEKSRRIGVTWAVGADAVLTSSAARSAGGMDTLYIGYNLDMAREFIDTCAMWAKAFAHAAAEVEEFVFRDHSPEGDRDIQAFRISFDSGFEITALASRPRSLRGRQGYVIVDEAAFHDDLPALMKAAMALLMWGGKVLIISTHDGDLNPFNELVKDIRAGRKPYALIRTTFDDALADDLYKRICLVTRKTWSEEAEAAWRQEMIDFYGDDADEELHVVAREGSGTWLSRALIEARMTPDAPVIRWEQPGSFAEEPQHIREADTLDWCEEHLKPLLTALDPTLDHVFGEDFARNGDLTVIKPLAIGQDLVRRAPFVVELRNIPFEQQKQILFYIVDRLPRFRAGALDARGNGQYLAEVAMQRYGSGRIAQVMLTNEWYRENMPRYKAAFEDAMILLPRDADIVSDHRAIVMEKGIAKLPEGKRAKGQDKKQRHGDAAIAGALAWFASEMDVAPIEFQSTGNTRIGLGAFDQGESAGRFGNDRRPRDAGAGWGSIGGGNDFGGF